MAEWRTFQFVANSGHGRHSDQVRRYPTREMRAPSADNFSSIRS